MVAAGATVNQFSEDMLENFNIAAKVHDVFFSYEKVRREGRPSHKGSDMNSDILVELPKDK